MTSVNILLADDSLPSLFATKAMLEKLGYRVTTAEQGDQALSLACEIAYDLILLDEHLPGRRGSDIAAYLRHHETPNTDTTLISITGETDRQEMEKILASGINTLIEKPVSLKKLEVALKAEATPRLEEQTIATLINDLGLVTAHRLLKVFEKELHQLIERLTTADDLVVETHAVSHILKNSASLYGAFELAEFARELNENTELTNENTFSAAKKLIALCNNTISSVEQTLASEAQQ